MRIPLLLDADKSITQSASTFLRDGHWKMTCDDSETTFQVITGDSKDINTDFSARSIKVLITKRGDKSRISIHAELIGDGINS